MQSAWYSVIVATCSLFNCRFAEAQEKPKFTRDVLSILGSVPLAPPELAADMLIRLAASPAVPDRAPKKQLFEDAVRLAGAAKYPFKLRGTGPNAGLTDSNAAIVT